MLLSGGDAYRTLYALSLWVLSGSDDIRQVIDFSEPRFDGATADMLVAQVEAQTVIPHIRSVVLPSVAVELWDLLQSETIDRLLGQLRPIGGATAVDPEVRHLWGRTALVAPEVWRRRVAELEPAQQAALLETLPVAAITSLDEAVAEQLAAAGEASETLSAGARSALLLIQYQLGRETALGEVAAAEEVAAEVALREGEALEPMGSELPRAG
jgi:hypothetical protein